MRNYGSCVFAKTPNYDTKNMKVGPGLEGLDGALGFYLFMGKMGYCTWDGVCRYHLFFIGGGAILFGILAFSGHCVAFEGLLGWLFYTFFVLVDC